MPWPIVREVLFELGVPDKITRDQFLQGMRKVGEKYVKLALKITDPLARMVGEGGLTLGPIATEKSRHKEEMIAANPNSIHMFGDLLLDTPVNDPVRGYVGLQTQPITAQHVRLVANFVRAAGRLAVKVGAAKTVVEMAEKRARMLDDEAEKGYKAQGLILRIHGLRGEQSAKEALQLFEEAEQASLRHDHSWFWLGLTLYDGNHYEEAMEAFRRTAQITNERLYRAASWVWEGHLYDLMGNRENALKMYRKALEEPFPGRMLHDQYGIAIDEEWVKKKLKQPFKRVEWKEKYLKDT